jgi:hypothetical protein
VIIRDHKQAEAHAGRLEVIKVNSPEDALDALPSVGGDLSVPGPRPPASPG